MEWSEGAEFVNRAPSFPYDRGYYSRNHPELVGRRTGSSLIDDTRLHRQGTSELEGRRSNRRLRYTIPLKNLKTRGQIPEDEEKGLGQKNGYSIRRPTLLMTRHELIEFISTKWFPGDDGGEVVTLTTRNPATLGDKPHSGCESRWLHIKSEAPTFKEFENHMMGVPGLDDVDKALALTLLKKVQKTYEKHFVHGRFLKPLTLEYSGAKPDPGEVSKKATFLGLPVFTTECARQHTSSRYDDLHPVRALLQSRYRLESTQKRDRQQVITKSKLHENHDHIVHVPQVWALIINDHTVITCAPFEATTMRGDTINLMSYAAARMDEATWSVQFTVTGFIYYLPLRLVKSFFSLVKQVSEHIINVDKNFVEHELLKNGLVTKDDEQVTAETWPGMVEKKKTEIIQLRLSEKQQALFFDTDDNESGALSESSSDISEFHEHQDQEHRHSSVGPPLTSTPIPIPVSRSSSIARSRSRSSSRTRTVLNGLYRQRSDGLVMPPRRPYHSTGSRYYDNDSRRRSRRQSQARPRYVNHYYAHEHSRPRNLPISRLYYQPSDKQLARSLKTMLRSQSLSGRLPTEREVQAAPKSSAKHVLPPMLEGHTTAGQSVVAERESPTHVSLPAGSLQILPQHDPPKGHGKKVNFERLTEEVKPGLNMGTSLSNKVPAILPNVQLEDAEEKGVSSAKHLNKIAPIFLWSTEHSLKKGPASGENQAKTSKMPAAQDYRTFSTSNSADLLLHTATTEAHAKLTKCKYMPSKFAKLYEETTPKSFGDILILRDELKRSTSLGDRDNSTSVEQGTIKLAISIMYAFVPDGHESAVVDKYWGALYQLLTDQNKKVLHSLSSHLTDVWDLLQNIREGVRADDGDKQAEYQIPKALPLAFQRIVLSLVIIGSRDEDRRYSRDKQDLLNECYGWLVDGRKELMLMMHTSDHRLSAGFEAVNSGDLLSLLLANLIDHLSTDKNIHLTEVYSEYTTNIQSVVRDQASVKVYDDLKLLTEEIDVIKSILKEQQDVLSDFRRILPGVPGTFSLGTTIIKRTLDSIEQRIDEFTELDVQAELARFNAQQSILIKAESNNKAIIVFTIVTIIFLPLSFVTSYFGMNTSDLRNMRSGQTLFWAVGIPVAVMTSGVALMVAFYGTLTHRLTGKAWREKEKDE